MKKVLLGVLGIVIVLIIIGAASGGSNKTEKVGSSSSTPTATQAPTVVDATTLIADYDKNKIAAQDKYTGKTVQTTAYITNISTEIGGNYYLSLKPSSDQYYIGTTIACYFADKSAKSQLTSLENGQSVTVQGTMGDMSLGTVVMNNCQVVK